MYVSHDFGLTKSKITWRLEWVASHVLIVLWLLALILDKKQCQRKMWQQFSVFPCGIRHAKRVEVRDAKRWNDAWLGYDWICECTNTTVLIKLGQYNLMDLIYWLRFSTLNLNQAAKHKAPSAENVIRLQRNDCDTGHSSIRGNLNVKTAILDIFRNYWQNMAMENPTGLVDVPNMPDFLLNYRKVYWTTLRQEDMESMRHVRPSESFRIRCLMPLRHSASSNSKADVS